MITRYDAGLLPTGWWPDDWWQDYVRTELDRAHDFYSDQYDQLQARCEEQKRQLLAAETEIDLLRSNAIYWHDEYDKLLNLASSMTSTDSRTLEKMLEPEGERG